MKTNPTADTGTEALFSSEEGADTRSRTAVTPKQNLLYELPEEGIDAGGGAVYDLSLDRSIAYVCADTNKRRNFLRVLMSPPRLKANITARQGVLHDFISNPQLYAALSAAVHGFAEAQADFNRQRGQFASSAKKNDSNARAALIISASHLYEVIGRVTGLHELFGRYRLFSTPLCRLRDRFCELAETNAATLASLESMLARLRNVTAEDSFTVTSSLTSDCRLIGSELSLVEDYDAGRGLKKLLGREHNAGRLPLSGGDAVRNTLLGEGFRETAALLANLSAALYGELDLLPTQLDYYGVALDYYLLLRHKDVAVCFPEITDAPALDCRGLCDLLLCFEEGRASNVVANDVLLAPENEGMIIRGENNSGKTVYLRAAGTAALLAQSGLPIPALSAVCGIFTGVFSAFAAAEKEFEAGNEAGRFEQEVRELAAVIDAATPSSLVLLNESFQTTAYSEGAEGLYHILRYFTSIGIKWVAVTHLPELETRFAGDSHVARLRTVSGFRLEKAPALSKA